MGYLTERERLTVSTMLRQMVRPVQWRLTVSEGEARSDLCVDLIQELKNCNPNLVQTTVTWMGASSSSPAPAYPESLGYRPQWVLANER